MTLRTRPTSARTVSDSFLYPPSPNSPHKVGSCFWVVSCTREKRNSKPAWTFDSNRRRVATKWRVNLGFPLQCKSLWLYLDFMRVPANFRFLISSKDLVSTLPYSKGTVARDFRPLFCFMNRSPIGRWSHIQILFMKFSLILVGLFKKKNTNQWYQRRSWYCISSVWDTTDVASIVSQTMLMFYQLCLRQCWCFISSVSDNADVLSAVSQTMLMLYQQCLRQCW
jgi:hypothetical protein